MRPKSCEKLRRFLPEPPGDARLVQIVGRHFHFHAVADGQAHPAFAHFAADGREDEMLVVQFDAEHRAGQHGRDATFDFNVFFSHESIVEPVSNGRVIPPTGRLDAQNEKGGVRLTPNPAVKILKGLSSVRDGLRRHRRHRRRIHGDRHHHRRRARVLRVGGRH
jgi:hypothetical protein